MKSSPLSVLVVDDSPIMVSLLARLMAEEPSLRLAGTATTPATAIAAIETIKPDVTVLDLMLDGGSGFDVLAALNEKPGPRPNVIVLTNLTADPYRERAAELGAAHFFDKSSEITVMLKSLIGLAEERDRRNRHYPPGHECASA